MLNTAQGLIKNGNQLKVIAISTPKHQVKEEGNDFYKKTEFEHVFINTRVNPIKAFFNLFRNTSYNIERFKSRRLTQKLKKLLREEKFDIIHLESLYVLPYLQIIRENSDAKVILRAHNVEHHLWDQKARVEKNKVAKWYLQLLTRRLKSYELENINKVDGIAAIAPGDAVYFKTKAPETPVKYIPFGMEIPEVNEMIQARPSLFFLGAFDWLPNREGINWFLSKVWPELHKNHSGLDFHIAGKSMPEEWRSKSGNGLHFHGEVPSAREFMQNHEIMMVPLFRGSGIKIKVLEAMALGKTVIATPKAIEGIHCEDRKDILIAEDAATFSKALGYCLENPEKRKAIGKNAREHIKENYNLEAVTGKLVEFYHNLARK